jgi:hypothetical protein
MLVSMEFSVASVERETDFVFYRYFHHWSHVIAFPIRRICDSEVIYRSQ